MSQELTFIELKLHLNSENGTFVVQKLRNFFKKG